MTCTPRERVQVLVAPSESTPRPARDSRLLCPPSRRPLQRENRRRCPARPARDTPKCVPRNPTHPVDGTGESAPRPARDMVTWQASMATRYSACSTCPRASAPFDGKPAITHSTARTTCAGTLVFGGSGRPSPLRFSRDLCFRWRAASRALGTSAAYRSRACSARRLRRHSSQHVFWCFLADGLGWYLRPHSQHRRRPSFLRFASIFGRSPTDPPCRDFLTSHDAQLQLRLTTLGLAEPPPTGSRNHRR